MSARDCVILRFELNRGGRGSLFLIKGIFDGEGVAASLIVDVVVCDAERGIDAGGTSVGVAWKF